MDNVILELIDSSRSVTLNLTSTDKDISANTADVATYCDNDTFITDVIRDPAGYYGDGASGNAIVSQGTIVKIIVSLDSSDTNMELSPNEHMTIRLIPRAGTPTYETIYTPETFTGRYIELL